MMAIITPPLVTQDDYFVHNPFQRGSQRERPTREAHAHNLAMIQSEQRLQRILTAYRCLDDADKQLLMEFAEELRASKIAALEKDWGLDDDKLRGEKP